MALLRVFDRKTHFDIWHERKPDVDLLLNCFLKPETSQDNDNQVVSTYEVRTHQEELFCAAALFLTRGPAKEPEKRHGIRLEHEDCLQVGIAVELLNDDKTGVVAIDALHTNLRGTKAQFRDLVCRVVERIWAGEQRICVFPARQIAGEIAFLSELPEGFIEHEARVRCRGAIGKINYVSVNTADNRIEIRGDLGSGEIQHRICATRSISEGMRDFLRMAERMAPGNVVAPSMEEPSGLLCRCRRYLRRWLG